MSFSIRSEAAAGGKRRFIIEITPGKFFFTCFLLLFGLGWMFTFGIMIGRGFNPEESVPALAHMMPTADGSVTISATGATPPSGSAPSGVIKTEELDLLRSLRTKETDYTEPVASKPAPEKKQAEPVEKSPEQKTPPAQKKEATYRYLYQAASLKDIGAAKRFAAHLEEAGLNTSIERVDTAKGVWHRINVAFKGTAADAESIKRKLAALGVQKPLLKEQDAITE